MTVKMVNAELEMLKLFRYWSQFHISYYESSFSEPAQLGQQGLSQTLFPCRTLQEVQDERLIISCLNIASWQTCKD